MRLSSRVCGTFSKALEISRWWGQAADGQVAVEMASELHPDVVVMDLIMPVKNGIDSCREIMDELPGTRVLVLTMSTEQDAVVDSLAAGATGYLQKVCGRQEFLTAVRDVAAGQYRIPNDAMRRVLAGAGRFGSQAVGRIDSRQNYGSGEGGAGSFRPGPELCSDRRGQGDPADNGA